MLVDAQRLKNGAPVDSSNAAVAIPREYPRPRVVGDEKLGQSFLCL